MDVVGPLFQDKSAEASNLLETAAALEQELLRCAQSGKRINSDNQALQGYKQALR